MHTYSPSSNFAIVIPAYNEEATIHDIAKRALLFSPLVFVIDDGSTDHTIEKIADLPVTLIKHEINQGKAASLWHGIQAALQHEVPYIITLDGDGQHAPEDISTLLAKAEGTPERIIIGARLADKSAIPAKRYYANRIANFWIAWAAGYPISDSQSGFRVYPSQLFDQLKISISKQCSFVFESEILIKAAQRGIKSTAVAIPAVYTETARPSHFRGVRDITFITLMVARSLFTRGMFLPGLYRSCIKPHLLPKNGDKSDSDGYLMLLISSIVIIASFGLTLLLAFIYVLKFYLRSSCQNNTHNLVVLGKKLRNGLPDTDYKNRLQRALEIIKHYPDLSIYILGGKSNDSDISEADAGKLYLQANVVSDKNIHLEESSRNTLENMKQLRASNLLKEKHICLITSRYHLARATIMAKGFGFKVDPCPAEESNSLGVVTIMTLLVEAFHIHWYFSGLLYAKLTHNQRMLSRIT